MENNLPRGLTSAMIDDARPALPIDALGRCSGCELLIYENEMHAEHGSDLVCMKCAGHLQFPPLEVRRYDVDDPQGMAWAIGDFTTAQLDQMKFVARHEGFAIRIFQCYENGKVSA